MAVAGKVAITLSTENGGAWSADVTYDRLVAVKHNNNLYISRKTVANIEPPNDEFWFLALEGFGGEDVEVLIDRMNELSDLIQAIIDGTTQVGNAKKLDGHGAGDFVQNVVVSSINNTDDPNTTEKSRIRTKHANCPTADVEYIIDTIFTDDIEDIFERRQTAYGTTGNNVVYIRAKQYNGSWSEWKEVATMVDLANYIAKADKPTGTYTGNGSATQRIIATGGIGNVVVVTSVHGTAIVAHSGGVKMNASSIVSFGSETSSMFQGNMAINTDDARLNASGVTYTYNVL